MGFGRRAAARLRILKRSDEATLDRLVNPSRRSLSKLKINSSAEEETLLLMMMMIICYLSTEHCSVRADTRRRDDDRGPSVYYTE